MENRSPRKPIPLPFLLFLGYFLIFYFTFQKIHPFHPAVYTPAYLLLVDVPPSLLTLGIILYGFAAPSYRRPFQVLLLIFSLWDMTGCILNTCDLWNLNRAQIDVVFKSWSVAKTFLKGDLQNFGSFVLDFLVGWSYLKKKPFGFDYPQLNPLQDVFMKFIGALWVLDAVYLTGLHLMILMYKIMRMV